MDKGISLGGAALVEPDRDRALVAFWISTGVRASELLGMRQCDIYPGRQLTSVVRKAHLYPWHYG